MTDHIDPPNATVLPAAHRNRPVYGPRRPVEEQLRETQQALAASQADLTRVEAERDWERQAVAMLRKNEEIRARVIRERNAERERLRADLADARNAVAAYARVGDLALAELATARTELDLLRAARPRLPATAREIRAWYAERGLALSCGPAVLFSALRREFGLEDSPPIPAGDTNKEIQ